MPRNVQPVARRLFAVLLSVGSLLQMSALGADGTGSPSASMQAAPATGAEGQLPKGMREEAVRDPALNMSAYFVAIPADWQLEAAVFQGTGCSGDPFPAFRGSSSDGLTQLERLPRFDWKWGDAPWLPKKTQPGCLPLTEAMSAADFLKQLSAVSQVEYVASVPVPADKLEAQKKNFERLNEMSAQMAARFHAEPTTRHGEMAQAKVRYRTGSAPMEALLFVNLVCAHNPVRDFKKRAFSVDTCSATVRVVRAPLGKLDDAVKRLELAGARENQQWVQARMNLENLRSQAMAKQTQDSFNQQMQVQNQQFQQSEALKLQQHEQFQQSEAMKLQQHQQSLSTMQRGTDMSMQRAQQSANASHTAASDTVDYALGQQTVRDPNTGQVTKVSGAYTNTWLDRTGTHSLQSNDSNANPNGYVQGTWTQQQQVHGDGTSK